ncbi:MAG: tetratricopeptide repeat protein [Thermoguttaceae bacterium]|nr:tetratricopeptide repeat protein [Thermoguttaceae bacterium]MDW8039696.1 tetratricopeptide repeat protein [Thermoguttaceae bacterium]
MVPRRTHRVLNWKLVVGLLVGGVVVVGGVLLLHAVQVQRTAEAILREAEAAEAEAKNLQTQGKQEEAEKKLQEAVQKYQRYIGLQPKDTQNLAKLALLLATQAEKPGTPMRAKLQAREALEMASSRDPENPELLRKLADISFQVGMHTQATTYYRRLRELQPNDPSVAIQLARSLIQTEHFREALSILEQVVAEDKSALAAYEELANLLMEKMQDPDRAEGVVQQMILANPDQARAYVIRARLYQRRKEFDKARQDIQKALELAPRSVEVLLTAAELALAEGNLARASQYVAEAAVLAPGEERVLAAQARLGQLTEDFSGAAEALRQMKDPQALIPLVSVLLQKGDAQGVRDVIKKMEKLQFRPEVIQFFEAQVLILERQWRKASYLLERIRPDLERLGDLARRADLLLGACYEQLGLPDKQLAAYQRVLEYDPNLVMARIGAASALLRMGQIERAVAEFRKIRNPDELQKAYQNAGLRPAIYRLLVAEAFQTPEGQRDWSRLEEFFEKMGPLQEGEKIPVALMRADLLTKQGKLAEARSLIEQFFQQHPNHPGLASALIGLVAAQEGPESALKMLEEFQGKLADDRAVRLMQISLAAQLGGQRARAILAELEQHAEKLPQAHSGELWEHLGLAYYLLGARPEAQRAWKKAVSAGVSEPRLFLALFELSREMDDGRGMQEAADQLAEALGRRSAEWNYAEAARLVWAVRKGQLEHRSLVRAKQHLHEARQSRPTWHKLLLLEGEIALMENRPDDAIRLYQEASNLAPLDPLHLQQLVQLLYARGRFEEAKQQLDRLGQQAMSPQMERLRIELDERTGQLERALELAAQTVAKSNQATDFLWYGHLLSRAGKLSEAEQAFRRAIELAPALTEAWLACVAALMAQNKPSEAEKLLRQAQVQLPQDQAPLFLAHAYELIGQPVRAAEQYELLLQSRPNEIDLLDRAAAFYFRTGQLEKAAKTLNELLELAQKDPKKYQAQILGARRALARTLAAMGDYRRHLHALRLVDENIHQEKDSLVDLQLKALILAKRPERAAQQQAIEILETVQKQLQIKGQRLSPEEQFLLAQLYDSVGQWTMAREQMLDLLAQRGVGDRFVEAYLEMLFRHAVPASEIKVWLNRLEKIAPNAPPTVAMKARYLVLVRQPQEAVELVKKSIPRPLPPEQVARLRDAAALLEELNQYEAARQLYQEFAETAPGGSIVLAEFLGRHGTLDEALAQCEAAIGTLKMEAIITSAVNILTAQRKRATQQHFRKVEGWILQALEENPLSRVAPFQLARLLDLQGRYDELIRIYRELMGRSDLSEFERAAAANNLAYVLAVSGKNPKEALEYVQQAIAILGPMPYLLDTQAMAYFGLGEPGKAVALLREAISMDPTGLRYFHLALAHMAANDQQAAAKALQVAKDAHALSIDQIPELERALYQELVKKVGSF